MANTIDLDQNKLSGPLPPSWGNTSVLPALLNLVLGENQCVPSSFRAAVLKTGQPGSQSCPHCALIIRQQQH